MQTTSQPAPALTNPLVITPQALLEHWQGHRRLTRQVIVAFPPKEFFTYSIGGMRPCSELVMEMISITLPGIESILTGKWQGLDDLPTPTTKEQVLALWDQATQQLDALWHQIPPARFQEAEVAFGQYPGAIYEHILYFIDNEIHHRGQAYVYLRSLGIEPPAFWDRN